MPLPDLLDALRREVETRAAALVSAARAEAAQAVADAEARLGRQLAEAVAERERELRLAAASEIAAGRQRATADVLRARAAALEKVLARARALLDQRARDPALAAHWQEVARDARSYVRDGRASVRLPPDVPGVSLTAEDGSVDIDATVDALLTRLQPSLAIEVVRELDVPS